MLLSHGCDCAPPDTTLELLIKRRGGRSHVIITYVGLLYRLCVLWSGHVKKGRALKTLPDFISRSAEHSLWDGDIYMALYTTASRWKPKALAKSGTRTNECGGKLENKEEVAAEEVHMSLCSKDCITSNPVTIIQGSNMHDVSNLNYAVVTCHPCDFTNIPPDVSSVQTRINKWRCVWHTWEAAAPSLTY